MGLAFSTQYLVRVLSFLERREKCMRETRSNSSLQLQQPAAELRSHHYAYLHINFKIKGMEHGDGDGHSFQSAV